MNRKRKAATAPVTARRLFPRRHPRIPTRVQASADLWLEMFQGFCDGLLIRDDYSAANSLAAVRAALLVEEARQLADAALAEFESRWPEVQP